MALRVAMVAMALLAIGKLGDEFRRLLLDTSPSGAIDLKLRYQYVQGWFAGEEIYHQSISANYPPASQLLLWPLLGWLELEAARWLWALLYIVALGWLVYLLVSESGAEDRWEGIFVALLLLSTNATGVTIGNGQLILYILPLLVTGLTMLHRHAPGWRRDLLSSGLLLLAMIKPPVSIPFLWLALFAPGGIVVVSLVVVAYAGLTIFAASFQQTDLPTLLQEWLNRAAAVALRGGYADLHTWMNSLGLEQWILPASFLVFLALGLWIYVYRRANFWLLLGVTAIVARLWTYHRIYDNVLIILPMITLFRLAKSRDITAGLLLALTIPLMLAPARLSEFPPPWDWPYKLAQPLVWIIILIFLGQRAHRQALGVETNPQTSPRLSAFPAAGIKDLLLKSRASSCRDRRDG